MSKLKASAVKGECIRASFEPGNGSRFECFLSTHPSGDCLSIPNFQACMLLPSYWRRDCLSTGYFMEKLEMSESDAAGVLEFLAKVKDL